MECCLLVCIQAWAVDANVAHDYSTDGFLTGFLWQFVDSLPRCSRATVNKSNERIKTCNPEFGMGFDLTVWC